MVESFKGTFATTLSRQKSLMSKNEIQKMRRLGRLASEDYDHKLTGNGGFTDAIRRAMEVNQKENVIKDDLTT